MNAVLIVTRDFTPYCGQPGWMMRAVTMANFLAERGYDVTVVAAMRSRPAATLDLNPDVQVRWVYDVLEHHRYDERAWLRLPVKVLGVLAMRVTRWLRMLSIDRSIFSLALYRKGIREVCRDKDIRNIIVSTPPHSLQTLVPWIRATFPGVNLVSDFRDAWSLRPLHGRQRWMNRKIEAMEEEIVPQVDHALFVSDSMRNLYEKKYRIRSSITVENGFSGTPIGSADARFENVVRQYQQEGRTVLGYFGSGAIGYPGHEKNLAVLLRAIESDPRLQRSLAIVIQGSIDVNPLFRVNVTCSLFDPVDYAVAMAHMKLVDFGINLFDFSLEYAPGVIAGKTYEYIFNALPIIAIAPKTANDLQSIVSNTGGYFADINDEADITAMLKQVVVDAGSSGEDCREGMSEDKRMAYSRIRQYEKLLPLLA